MIELLPICLINPGTERVMCTRKRKNVNYTDNPMSMTCLKCIEHHAMNMDWWLEKLPQEVIGFVKRITEDAKGVNVEFKLFDEFQHLVSDGSEGFPRKKYWK